MFDGPVRRELNFCILAKLSPRVASSLVSLFFRCINFGSLLFLVRGDGDGRSARGRRGGSEQQRRCDELHALIYGVTDSKYHRETRAAVFMGIVLIYQLKSSIVVRQIWRWLSFFAALNERCAIKILSICLSAQRTDDTPHANATLPRIGSIHGKRRFLSAAAQAGKTAKAKPRQQHCASEISNCPISDRSLTYWF